MNVRHFLPAVLFVGALVALVYMGWFNERTVALVEVTEGPRPPVTGDPHTRPIVLRGIMGRFQASGNDLRNERNEIAERHKQAVASWRAGKTPLRDVEDLEQLLWVARFKVGEIDAQTLHTRLAELFAREVGRLELLAKQGMAGPYDVERARLYTARERHLAGLPPRGRDYASRRRTFLAEFKRRHELLLEGGYGTREQVRLEWETLNKEFPAPDAP